MLQSIVRISYLSIIFFLAGCSANFSSIFRTTEGNRSHVAFTDAKQSATIIQVGKDGVLRACAARSPDVFSALATAGSGSADFAKAATSLGLAGAGSSAEAAASFGLRTQLTQTQIELLYQLCIEALNGKLSNDQLATELHRYQNTMVTMLAIEQLTGYAKPTVVALGSKSGTGSTKELLALQQQVNAARKLEASAAAKVEAANVDVQKKQTAFAAVDKAYQDKKKAKPNDPGLPALKKTADAKKMELDAAKGELEKAQAGLKDAKRNRSILEATLKNAQDDLDTAAASGEAQIGSPTSSFYVGVNAEAAQTIASVVRDIQQTHLWQSFATDDCLRFLLQDTDKKILKWEGAQKQGLYELCKQQIVRATEWRFQNLYLLRGCDTDGTNCVKPPAPAVAPPAPPVAPPAPPVAPPAPPVAPPPPGRSSGANSGPPLAESPPNWGGKSPEWYFPPAAPAEKVLIP